jgi:transposase
MVFERRGEYASLWTIIEFIAPKIGCVAQTLHDWVRKHEIDTGARNGLTSEK